MYNDPVFMTATDFEASLVTRAEANIKTKIQISR